jgi:PAS domain S-box-containing protein
MENNLSELDKFRQLFDQAPLGYQSLDIKGNFLEVNQKWLDILGYEKDEVIGKWFGSFLPPAYQAGFKERFPIFKAQGHIHSEFEMVHKNGNILFIAFDGRIGHDEEGNFKQTHCILKDITEEKKNQNSLKDALELLKNAGKITKFGGWNVILSENRSYWSDEVAEIHEMPAGHCPLVEDGINFYAPEWREKIRQVFTDCAQKGIPYDEEMEILTSKGKRVWIRTNAEAVRDENGVIYKVQGGFQDISDRKQAEIDLRNKNSELKETISLMVGRELKMIELKKEINELLKEMGREQRYEC